MMEARLKVAAAHFASLYQEASLFAWNRTGAIDLTQIQAMAHIR